MEQSWKHIFQAKIFNLDVLHIENYGFKLISGEPNKNKCLIKLCKWDINIVDYVLHFSRSFLVPKKGWVKYYFHTRNTQKKITKQIFALFTLWRCHIKLISCFDFHQVQLHADKRTVTLFFLPSLKDTHKQGGDFVLKLLATQLWLQFYWSQGNTKQKETKHYKEQV